MHAQRHTPQRRAQQRQSRSRRKSQRRDSRRRQWSPGTAPPTRAGHTSARTPARPRPPCPSPRHRKPESRRPRRRAAAREMKGDQRNNRQSRTPPAPRQPHRAIKAGEMSWRLPAFAAGDMSGAGHRQSARPHTSTRVIAAGTASQAKACAIIMPQRQHQRRHQRPAAWRRSDPSLHAGRRPSPGRYVRRRGSASHRAADCGSPCRPAPAQSEAPRPASFPPAPEPAPPPSAPHNRQA